MNPSFAKKCKMLAGRLAFRFLEGMASVVPFPIAQRLGDALGDFIYFASSRYRKVAIRNLAAAYDGKLSASDIRGIARQVFRHFARGAVEFFYLLKLKPKELDRMVDLSGTEHVDAALAQGNGAILLTGHLGHWEMLARRAAAAGYRINVIARNSDDVTMTGIARKIREGSGYKVLGRNAREALKCLRDNEILGILPDQNTAGGVFVDFFGRPAATAEGPAVFSLKTGAPILPTFARRGVDGKYHAVVYPPISVQLTGETEKDVHILTQALTSRIEEEIRKDPTQWLWLHDRWKRAHEAG
jgi:Kdo2-lipid IVA lauroyltransferase/acyltransferase